MTARSVRLVCEHYKNGIDFRSARRAVVENIISETGWFQAAGNIAFLVIGLLYSGGDFEKTICISNNPSKWTEPIGYSIETCSIAAYTSCRLDGEALFICLHNCQTYRFLSGRNDDNTC